MNTTTVPFAFGLLLMLLSLLGCCCEQEGNVCVDSVYGLLQFISGLAIVLAGTFIVVTINRWMYNIATEERVSWELDEGIGGVQQNLADFMLGLADGCCDSFTIKECPDTYNNTGGFYYCYLTKSSYDDGLNAGLGSRGKDAYCSFDALLKACNDADVNSFLVANYEGLDKEILPVGVALIVMGCLIFFASFLSCHLACKNMGRRYSSSDQHGGHDGVRLVYGSHEMQLA
mmetsp:Transcript_10761/g.12344  ORF Transcript_10761/g.12344 Transcript_10761/m.12344 type:complete len:230 (-) Transcript_10761:188-877(-)